jgi:UDP-GlcNAc3NAcA epimerase
MKKIVSIVGARPQFIKLQPFSNEVRKEFKEVIIHTGQHYDQNMSKSFFDDLKIPKPNYEFGIGAGTHGEQTSRMLLEVEKALFIEKPDFVVVFGDTNSTLAGALAATKINIPVIHIEAGLRSFNKEMPEEINRKITDHISNYLFVPTKTGMQNLKNEGLLGLSYLTGDIMVDSLKYALSLRKNRVPKESGFLLVTLHRPYNVDNIFNLVAILNKLVKLDNRIIFPIHPRTRKILSRSISQFSQKIEFIEPLGYLDFVAYMESSSVIITDSGGIQKEAYMLKKPCVTLRTETEWIETVKAGWNLLIDPQEVDYLSKISSFKPPIKYENIFGENVAEKMVSLIKGF